MKIGTWNEASTGNSSNSGAFPPISNFEIGTFNYSANDSSSSNTGGGNSQSGNNIQGGPGIRETGIIEKLLVSFLTN